MKEEQKEEEEEEETGEKKEDEEENGAQGECKTYTAAFSYDSASGSSPPHIDVSRRLFSTKMGVGDGNIISNSILRFDVGVQTVFVHDSWNSPGHRSRSKGKRKRMSSPDFDQDDSDDEGFEQAQSGSPAAKTPGDDFQFSAEASVGMPPASLAALDKTPVSKAPGIGFELSAEAPAGMPPASLGGLDKTPVANTPAIGSESLVQSPVAKTSAFRITEIPETPIDVVTPQIPNSEMQFLTPGNTYPLGVMLSIQLDVVG